ncbi:hypothetical protein RR48_05212 [Papilio machaon]|uniref:FLYWCH-type domain-containing protein n=1 Tax=Papilio machaon TaxID=76193 RepID=A0A0N1IP22_PAPMA|nr:hypothetical protein RR48_05212 [Papilio machaon]
MLGVIVIQEGPDNKRVEGGDAGATAELDAAAAGPAHLIAIPFVLDELVSPDVHHHVPTARQPEANFGLIGTGIDCFASYCLSKQGKMGINVGGYRFRFNGCARNGKIRWRCSRGPWCKAALHTYRGRIVYIQSTHNCGPKPPTV